MFSTRQTVTRFERTILMSLVVLMLIGAFVHLPDTAYRSLILTSFNFLHFPTFLLLYLVISRLLVFPRYLSGFGPLILTIILASLLELSQPLLGRSATITDFWVSSYGALTGCWLTRLTKLWIHTYRGKKFFIELAVFVFGVLVILFFLLRPVYHAGSVLYTKYHIFPELSAHRHKAPYNYWFMLPQRTSSHTQISIERCPPQAFEPLQGALPKAQENATCLKVLPQANAWAGIGQVLGPNSWSGFTALEIHFIAQAPMPLALRLDDVASGSAHHEGFNRDFELEAGLNKLEVPLAALAHLPKRGPLNLDKLRRIFLFTSPQDHPPTFYLARIFLKR